MVSATHRDWTAAEVAKRRVVGSATPLRQGRPSRNAAMGGWIVSPALRTRRLS